MCWHWLFISHSLVFRSCETFHGRYLPDGVGYKGGDYHPPHTGEQPCQAALAVLMTTPADDPIVDCWPYLLLWPVAI